MKTKMSKENIKRQKIDRERALRVVKYIDYPFILENSPVELVEGYIVSDRETYDVFASLIFKNIGKLPISKLNIRLSCYQNQNIPYLNIDFTYCAEDLTFGIISYKKKELKLKESNKRASINQGESFGSCVFIPLPESYFTKMEVYISSVEFADGSVQNMNVRVAGDSKRYSELDNISKLVYTRLNIYVSAESQFPTKVIPQFTQSGWMCCCGTKNSVDSEVCELCGREKNWQKESVSATALEQTKQQLISDPTERTLHDKTNFSQNKYLEDETEIQSKIEQYEKAMENVALAEKRRERKKMMFFPMLVFWGLVVYGFGWLISFLVDKF